MNSMRLFYLPLLLSALFVSSLRSQTAESIRKHVEYLTSDALAGRFPGTPGDSLAAAYIKGHFESKNLLPFDSGYYQYFDIKAGVEISSKNRFALGAADLKLFSDFAPLGISAEGEFSSSFFEFNIDSLIDGSITPGAENKWLVVDIGSSSPSTREYMRWASKSAKANTTGILFLVNSKEQVALGYDQTELPLPGAVTNEIERKGGKAIYSQNPDGGISRMVFSRGLVRSDIPLLIVTNNAWKEFLKTQKRKKPETGEIKAIVEINPVSKRTHNIIGIVKGTERPEEYIVLGAHYDHLGYGGPESGSRVPDQFAIHYGADDNASGTVTVMGLATRFAAQPLPVSVIFVAFGAEEMGLLGSQHMVRYLPVKKEKIKAMVNYDMVGRMEKNQLNIGGTKTSLDFQAIIDTLSTALSITTSPFGSGPSDHSSFNSEDIPVLYFNTGIHTDYHTPNDTPSKINYQGIMSVIDYSDKLLRAVTLPQVNLAYNRTESDDASRGSRNALKVTLGIIPDVTGGDNTGLLILGVNPNGVAHRAQLVKGDKIINIDGTPVKNVYDYMEKLQQIKPKQVAHIEVIREGEEKVFLLQF